jgi:indolepyruvate ferredoxin oxidoreductase alpha subunit
VENLLGNEAIVRGALEAGVAFAAGYPGTPSSEVTDSFGRVADARGVVFEYSINEKIALEMAFSASLAGARSICAMKHLGLMVAGDPISTIPYVGTVGGMVIVSAGDPSCHTSPNEQDQRHLGRMLHVPTLDPETPAEAHRLARLAFELSEAASLPVLLRVTTRVSHSRAPIRYGPLQAPAVGGFVRDPARFVPIPVNARRLRLTIEPRLDQARQFLADHGGFSRQGAGRDAIVASGSPAATTRDLLAQQGLEDRLVLATLAGVWPLPEPELLALLREVDRVLVVEELSPFLEDQLLALCGEQRLDVTILGKRSGHLPTPFEYSPGIIQQGIHDALGLGAAPPAEVTYEPVPPRPPTLCPGCPHRSSFFAARAAFGAEHLFFNDIGCYTLGYGAPLESADGVLCMGAGFTLAAGVARVTGQRTVGFMGDSTFFHAGMPPLLNAIKEDVNMVAVILDNAVTAMTGFQESPGVTVSERGPERNVDIAAVVRALGAGHVERVDPTDLPATMAAFERARDAQGLSVVITESPCPVFMNRETGAPLSTGTYEIDRSVCSTCGRDSCGQRCDQCSSTTAFERHLVRGRAFESTDLPRAAEAPTVAPCSTRCPLGLCIQGYVGHVAAGQYAEAFELIMSRNPLPDSVCRVCHRPCEDVCVRADVDEPIAINDLKRFVMDRMAESDGATYAPKREPDSGTTVAVVGAGPCGLAAAHDLTLRGYQVTLFDEAEAPGGLLRTGVPRFRLPLAALERDVGRILELGVRFVGSRRLGRDISLQSLLDDGFAAVALAVGAPQSVRLRVEGTADAAGVALVDALEYLARVRDGDDASTRGRKVVVVGGGNAAIDAARTALRTGAERVVIAYRRRREEMPALPEEIEGALDEGIELLTQRSPVSLASGGAPGLVCVRTEPGEPGPDGRRRPVVVPGSEQTLPADQIIVAIGQASDLGWMQSLELEHDRDGALRVDPDTGCTSHQRIFAGGDMTPGARTVTDAIADGQRLAWGIDAELRGREHADRRLPPPHPGSWPVPVWDRSSILAERTDDGQLRAVPPEVPAHERRQSFVETVQTLSEAEAQREAARCMACGSCGNCRSCLDLFGCPAFYVEPDGVHIDPELCRGCGLCARFCPNGAIRKVAEEAP